MTFEQIETERRGYPVRAGPDWRMFTSAFTTTVGDSRIVDPKTGTIYPWVANRPSYGSIVNHPVKIATVYGDKALFLACFWQSHIQPSQPQMQKSKIYRH